MDIKLVDEASGLDEVRDALSSSHRFALDCEAAGFHRYSDRLCLVQLTVDERTFLLDPLAVPVADLLRPPLEDPEREVVMHGADFDLRLLDRDLGIRLRGIFDTQAAASLLGIDGIGLSAVLERTLDVKLSKKYQRADWAERPLPEPMLRYAALDTHHLLPLADRLSAELHEAGRMEWAREEFEELEKIRYEEPQVEDPAARLKVSREMSDREVHRLREALAWRDAIAMERDRAAFRITNDSVLIEVARQNPSTLDGIESIRGMNRALARAEGEALLQRLLNVAELLDPDVQGLPEREHVRRQRPEPEEEERMTRLKAVRNRRAEELGIDRGTLLPNTVLQAIAANPPESVEEMRGIPGIRRWQARLLGPELLETLEHASASMGD